MELTTTHASELACAADLLKCAQVTTDYQALACQLAGPLSDAVKSVFPGHLLLVYLLTDTNRRQVWNAYLSSLRIAPEMASFSEGELAELRVRLLTCRSHALIVGGYGSCARGLSGLYGRLGLQALAPEFYVRFHATLTANDTLRRSLAHLPALDPRALSLLFTHPVKLQSYPLALMLIRQDNPGQFRELHDHLVRLDFPNKDILMDRLYRVARAGREFRIVLAEIRLALPFPPQVVPDQGRLRFIRNGAELINTADRYRNCLSNHVSDAFSGESQFYEWRCTTSAIICLKRPRGTTWCITAIGLEDNEDPPQALDAEIRAHLARHGIGDRRGLADLFDAFLSRSIDVTGEIELLEELELERRG